MKILNSEKVLLDSNILVYSIDTSSPFHQKSKEVMHIAASGDMKAVLAMQNILEFYAIVTSNRMTSHPLSSIKAQKEIQKLLSGGFTMIYSTEQTIFYIEKLLKESKTYGQKIYDLALVATMLANDISTILTFNTADFTPFTSYIRTINPLIH